MPKAYNYVGPPRILARSRVAQKGAAINCPDDFQARIWTTGKPSESLIVVTFVIDMMATLRIADRRSEHVACASGEPVLSAGEMSFQVIGNELEVVEVSNQSTGYCPEPDSWPLVALALNQIPILHPGKFTREFVFRRCVSCGQINIVKDDWMVCSVCEKELPKQWNLA